MAKETIVTVASCSVGGVTFTLRARGGVYFISTKYGVRLANSDFIRAALRDTLAVAVMNMLMAEAFGTRRSDVLTHTEFDNGVLPGLSPLADVAAFRDRLRNLDFTMCDTTREARVADRDTTVTVLTRILGDKEGVV